MSVSRRAALVIAALALAARAAPAQDPRLDRLDRETAAVVARLIDSARAAALPTDPLVGVALEGLSRRAAGGRIVQAVREYFHALRDAHGALGAASSAAEVVSGAGAVLSGVPPHTLRALRAARPRAPLTVPLVVLADLIVRGVPADTAAAAVVVATRAGLPDADLAALRRFVERDIVAGVPPGAALASRLQSVPGMDPLGPAVLDRAFGTPESGPARRPK